MVANLLSMIFIAGGCNNGISLINNIQLVSLSILKMLTFWILNSKIGIKWFESMFYLVSIYALIQSFVDLITTWNLPYPIIEIFHVLRIFSESCVGLAILSSKNKKKKSKKSQKNEQKDNSNNSKKGNENIMFFGITLAAIIAGIISLAALVPSVLANFLSHNWVSIGMSMVMLSKWYMEKSMDFGFLGVIYIVRISLTAFSTIYSGFLGREIPPDMITEIETAIPFLDTILLMLLLLWSHHHDKVKSLQVIRTEIRQEYSCFKNFMFMAATALMVFPELLLLLVPKYFPESPLVEDLLKLGFSSSNSLEECSNVNFGSASKLSKALDSQLVMILLLLFSVSIPEPDSDQEEISHSREGQADEEDEKNISNHDHLEVDFVKFVLEISFMVNKLQSRT
mmetsp:Transcript_12449/g.17309  ORF Transcript_12449/g.17309 Transcript_12449/m.17309 type:complete len:397 (-) Transcript_12449:407-1597(-)